MADRIAVLTRHVIYTFNFTDDRFRFFKREMFMQGDLILSLTSPAFYVSSVQILKTLWEKEELLVTSNSSFSHSVLYPY